VRSVAEDREVQVRDASAALDELRGIAVVEGEQILRPFVDSDPGFFTALADRLREAMQRYSEIARIDIEGEVDPDEGYPLIGVELAMAASPQRAHEIMDALFDDSLQDLYSQAPLELEVIAKPA